MKVYSKSVIVLIAVLTYSSAVDHKESKNEVESESTSQILDIKGLIDFLDHLERFYVQGGYLIHLQKQMLDLKNTDRSFKSIEDLVFKLEKLVDNLVEESEERKDLNPSKILEFFMTQFVEVRDHEIKDTEKQLVDAFERLKSSTQEGLTVYISERSKQKKMLKELIDLAFIAKVDLKNDAEEEFKDDQEFYSQRWKFFHGTRVLLHFAKATLASHQMNFTENTGELQNNLEKLKNQTKNEELLRMISSFEPQFKSLASLESKWKWVSTETHKMFKGRLYKNVVFAVTKTSLHGLNSDKDTLMKKMETKLEILRQRHEFAIKKMTDAENFLSNIVGSKVKMEL